MSSNNCRSATKKFNFCNTKLKTTREKFIWAIDNFSERQEKCKEYFRSSEFISKAPNGQVLKWQMEMFPNGNKEEHKDYVSIFLYLLDSNNEEVKANYQISLRNSDSDEFEQKFSSDHIKFGNSGVDNWGVFKLIKREDLFNKENGYLSGDRLTIMCKLVVQQESVEKAHIEVPESRVVEDLSNLFDKSLYTDCKIISEDDKEFMVHKCILGCRSPVFAAMFEHDMLEKNNNEINIEDMKGVVIEQMLRFIYSGKEPDLLEEMAEDLLIGADKYELPRLKLLCERKLIISIGTTNACRLLLLANLYLAKNLKNHAIDFIKMNVNEVKKSDGWKELLADKQLVEQILMAK